MNILHVCPIFPTPSPKSFGSGVINVVHDIGQELTNRGHEITVYASAVYDRTSRIKNINNPTVVEGIKVYHFSYIANYSSFYVTPGIVPAVRKNLRKYDIIHLHDIRCFQGLICYYYATKYGIPYVLQAHGSLPRTGPYAAVKRLFHVFWGHRILRDAAKLIALNPMEVQQYKNMNVNEDKIEIVPNGIDISEFDKLPQRMDFRKKYDLTDSQKTVLFLGRIHRIKGLELLLKAFAELSENLGDARLVIAGPDSGYLTELKEVMEELKIEEKVILTGPLFGRDKLEAYVDSDVFVLPSIFETFPVAVLEACACGLPVVVTDRCGIADTIDGQAGLVIPYDAHQLSEALLRMLSEDKIRRQFGEEGRLLVREKFDWSKIVERLEDIYHAVLNKR